MIIGIGTDHMDFSLSKEQQDIAKAARKFAASEFPDRAREFDREEKFDLGLWKKACGLGFVGVFIDKKYGGLGYGFFEHCLINEEFWAVDNGRVDHALIAMAKWTSGKTAVYCADEALQMRGGYGYIDEYKVQRLYRDAKILEIYEGTKEIEKTIVARALLR